MERNPGRLQRARNSLSYREICGYDRARAYRQLHNPFPSSPENIRAGMEHFADHCATCHANDGSGDTMFGKGMYPKPPDLRIAETQDKSDDELCYTIENGVRLSGMPAFGKEHDVGDADTWRLLLFIRHLPKMMTWELHQMTQLNPKTEEERQEEKQEEEFLRGDNPTDPGKPITSALKENNDQT
jgi:mono/diheme cytochrome c family protein